MIDWWFVVLTVGIVQIVMTFVFACWSEVNNRYPKTSMDLLWGLLWFITSAKWIVRLPSRGFSYNTARVFKDVWNG